MATYAHNRKAGFNFEIMEKIEAGIELLGHEVKSVRKSHMSLDGSYVKVIGNQVYLTGATISPFQPGNIKDDYSPTRDRKLLLTKTQIKNLSELAKGLTIVPISVYNKGRKIKVEIAIARGKKKFDKRETLKKRDTERTIRREVSDR